MMSEAPGVIISVMRSSASSPSIIRSRSSFGATFAATARAIRSFFSSRAAL